jgi:hypothetical protein
MAVPDCKLEFYVVAAIEIDLSKRIDEYWDIQGRMADGHDCNEMAMTIDVNKFAVQIGMDCECRRRVLVAMPSKSIVADNHAMAMTIHARMLMNA